MLCKKPNVQGEFMLRHWIKTRSVWFLIGIFLLFGRSAFAIPASDTPKVSIQLNWLHQFEFAGYYAALHKGFYKEAGFEVTLKEGSPKISPIDEVLQGRADFGVSSSGLVKSFLEGKPVLAVAPIFQHSPEVLLTLNQDIKTLSDVARAGAIGLQPGDESLDLKAMFINEGIALDKLTVNTEANGLKDLLAGNIVAMNAFLSNEPYFLKERGLAYNVIDPRQYGMDFYNGVLFTHHNTGKDRPEVVAAIHKATLKGWEYALMHPEEIITLILNQYNTQDKSRDYLTFEAKTLQDLIGFDVIQLGHNNLLRWAHIVQTYAKFGIIKFGYSLDGFLYDPNPPPPDLTWLYGLVAAVLMVLGVLASIAFYIHRLNRTLAQVNRVIEHTLIEKRQFMNMLTHELKAPISTVSQALEQLSLREPQKRRADHALDDMNNIVDRCKQLNHLEHSKFAMQIERCDLSEILTSLRAHSPDPDRLEIEAALLPGLDSDPQLLGIVMSNLLNNAFKYSPPLSMIQVEAQAAIENGKQGVKISVLNLPGTAGLPDAEKIFNKYYRSPGAKKQTGSGLGLYLVHSFTKLLGGQVKYDVKEGQARFSVWLPCQASSLTAS